MMSGTKQEENESLDNINTLLITSTCVMMLSCVMEALVYFLYNNKVATDHKLTTLDYFFNLFSVSSEKRNGNRPRG